LPKDPETGKRRQKWTTVHGRKADAERVLRRLLIQMDGGRWVDPALMTVAEFAGDWLDHIEGTVEPSTWRSYESHIRIHVEPRIGRLRLGEVTARRLTRMYRDIEKDAGVSVSTVRRVHATVRRMLHYAVKWEHLPANPARYADLPKATDRRDRIHTWTPEQLHRFFTVTSEDRWWTLWALLATTGLRRGEALGLAWDHVDLENGVITVEQQRTPTGIKRLKTSSARRRVTIPQETVDALRAWRKSTLEERLYLGDGWVDTGLVFVRETGAAPHPDGISKHFVRVLDRHQLPRIRLHDLRHTHATELLRAGLPAKTVSERLGHAGIHITLDTYTHLVPELHRQAADAAGRLLAPGQLG
jgi:integrase